MKKYIKIKNTFINLFLDIAFMHYLLRAFLKYFVLCANTLFTVLYQFYFNKQFLEGISFLTFKSIYNPNYLINIKYYLINTIIFTTVNK